MIYLSLIVLQTVKISIFAIFWKPEYGMLPF